MSLDLPKGQQSLFVPFFEALDDRKAYSFLYLQVMGNNVLKKILDFFRFLALNKCLHEFGERGTEEIAGLCEVQEDFNEGSFLVSHAILQDIFENVTGQNELLLVEVVDQINELLVAEMIFD